jgi:hypothetical protein
MAGVKRISASPVKRIVVKGSELGASLHCCYFGEAAEEKRSVFNNSEVERVVCIFLHSSCGLISQALLRSGFDFLFVKTWNYRLISHE